MRSAVRSNNSKTGSALRFFERHANGVQLNEIGRQLARNIDSGLEHIAAGVATARESARQTPMLTLSAPPTFLQLWLLPRLATFEAHIGGLDISLESSDTLIVPTWRGNGARLAIRYGRGPWSDVTSYRLLGDELFPVCAPALLKQHGQPMKPADLARHTLLEVAWNSPQSATVPGWQTWLETVGVANQVSPPQRRYSLSGLAVDQAIAGRGLMLASLPLVMDRLASGVLIRPFGEQHALASPMTYDLLTPAIGEASPAVARFVDWLLQEATVFDGEANKAH